MRLRSCFVGRTQPGCPSRRIGSAAGHPWLLGLASLLLLVPALGTGAEGPVTVNADLPASPFIAVGEAVRPAVVSIRITRAVGAGGVDSSPLQEMYRQFFPDREGEGGRFEHPGTGSGFVVDPDGEVLTNHHVIAGADRIFVRFPGESREYPAELVGSDPLTDLALLRIDPAGRALPYLAFGDSETLMVGDWVVAVGNPFGNLEGSMTVGILSAKGRGDLNIQGLTPRYQDFLQTDASINFGNSGGPLVDVRGRVVGVNTAINTQGQGIGFAVPSRMVQHIHGQLAEHGRVIRGWLGAAARERDGSVILAEIVPGSPAEAAGLEAGDRLLRFGGEAVTTQRQLQFLVAETPVGEPVTCEVEREGERLQRAVTLTELDLQRLDEVAEGHWLGMEVADLAGTNPRALRLKETLGIAASTGVMVVAIEAGRPGAEAGIRPGDVLVAIEDRDLPDLDAWQAARSAFAGRREPLNLLVRTGTSERFIQVTPRDAGTLQ
jgi:S1-C subfamily serine protease